MSSQQQQQQQQNTFVEVAQQLGNKELPTNQQLNTMIDSTQQFIDNKKNNPQVDPKAMKTMSDFQEVLDATKQLNENKNFDEKLQSALTQTTTAAQEVADKTKSPTSGIVTTSIQTAVEKQGTELMEKGKELTSMIWDLLKSMISSGELRAHVSTLLGIAQDVLSSAQDQLDSTPSNNNNNNNNNNVTNSDDSKIRISEEKKHKLAFNFLSVMRKFNQQPELKESMQNMIDIFHCLLTRQTNAVLPMVQEQFQTNSHVNAAFENSKTLIERFTNQPLDPVVIKTNAFFDFIRRDQRVQKWFDDAESLLRECFERPERLDEYEFTRKVEQLIDESRDVTEAREFKANYKSVVSELIAIVESIRDDPDLQCLQQKTVTFLENFTYTDAQGTKHFNTDLMQNLRQFVVPLLVAQLDTIPLPNLEGSNDDYDYHFDNVVLHGREIFPDSIEIHTRSDAKIDLKNLTADQARSQAVLLVRNIKFSLSDVHFRFDRKTFPKVSDEGTASLHVEGNSGVSLLLRFEIFLKDNSPHVKLNKVNFDISKLTIDIQSTQHEVLTRLFATFYQTRLKMLIEQNAEQKIQEIFNQLETGINDLFTQYPSKLKNLVEQKATDAMSVMGSQQAIQS